MIRAWIAEFHPRWRLARALRPYWLIFQPKTPLSRAFGFDRGLPVDRHYIEAFLAAHAQDIHGRVLEVGDDSYSRRFGGERIGRQDVIHVSSADPQVTIVGDLASPGVMPSDAFDSMVLTQTLHLIYDLQAATREIYRALKTGGVALVTVPGISQIDAFDWGHSWYWALTPHSARRLFEDVFGSENITIQSFGNVLAATAFLQGAATQEVGARRLAAVDPSYPVIIAIRAQKRSN